MNRPADDGGGGSGALIDRLEPLFTELIDLIGQLAGNEAALRVIKGQEEQPLQEGWSREPGYFHIPGPHGFSTQALYVAMHLTHPDFETSPVNNAQREQLVQEAIDTVWEQERTSWVQSAVEIVYRSVSQDVWESDPGAMVSGVQQLQAVTVWLNEQIGSDGGWGTPGSGSSPAWLGNLQTHWPTTSQSSSTFFEFWDDVNDKCGLYLHAMARLASTSAQVAGTLSDFQSNLLEATEKARDHAKQALGQWQAWKNDSGSWPSGAMQDNGTFKTILGGVSTATGLIALFPPAAVVSGGISLVTDLGNYLVPEMTVLMEIRDAVKASELHNAFLDDLNKIVDNQKKALDSLQTTPPGDGGTTGNQDFSSLTGDVAANRSDWRPLEVQL